MTKRVLFVYNGEGVDERARDQLFLSLKESVCPKTHSISYIQPADIIKGDWVQDASLLAIGGGYDLGLIRALGDDGIGAIRKYVREGGSYLGICSGAYFACDHIEFDKNGPLEVCGERHLKFFPGLCVGPVFPGFQYKMFQGAVAAPTDFWDAELHKVISFHSYFNGGGYFQPYKHAMTITKDLVKDQVQPHFNHMTTMTNGSSESPSPQRTDNIKGGNSSTSASASSVEILAKFSSVENSPLSIVKTRYGLGLTVLAGIHIEYCVNALPEDDPYVENMIKDLKMGENARKQCFVSLLRHLNISCRDNQ